MREYDELEIMALAKDDVFTSTNCECLMEFEEFFSQSFKDLSDRQFDNSREELKDIFYGKYGIACELEQKYNSLSSTEEYDDLPEPPDIKNINDLSDDDELTYYKSKSILLECQFAYANKVYISVLLPLIDKMLEMREDPKVFLDRKGILFLEKMLKLHRSSLKGGRTLHQKVAKRAEKEKNELLSIYNRIKEKDEYKKQPKKAKHVALLEFCLNNGILSKSIEKAIPPEKSTPEDKTSSALKQLRDNLNSQQPSDVISFLTGTPSLKDFRQKMLRQIRQRLDTAKLFRQQSVPDKNPHQQ